MKTVGEGSCKRPHVRDSACGFVMFNGRLINLHCIIRAGFVHAHCVLCLGIFVSHYRAAAFDVTGRKSTETPSVIFIRLHGKKVVISTVVLEMQAARSTTVSTVAVAQLPCRLD